ncbi:hypothetical protein LCL95_09815 [Bacillus timonensis]|nr:hypothetical protein [Bacillus timonensis]
MLFNIRTTELDGDSSRANAYNKIFTYMVVIQVVFVVLAIIPGVNLFLKVLQLPVLLLLWFVFYISKDKVLIKPWMILGIIWLVYMLLIGYGLNDFKAQSRLITDGSLFFFMFIINDYLYRKDMSELSRIGKYSAVMIIITLLYSYFVLRDYPMLARDTASGLAGSKATGIAGYDYIYGLVILIPLFTSKMIDTFKNGDKKNGTLFTILLILSLVYITKSQFATALLLSLVGIILGLLVRKVKSVLSLFINTLLIVLFLLLAFNIVNVLLWLTSILDSMVLKERIYLVINLFQTKDFVGIDRFDRMNNTLNAFFEYPFGAVFYGARFMYDTLGVDFHTEWLSTIAYFGWQGLLLFTAWILAYLREVVRRVKQYTSLTYIYVQFIMIFLVGLFNPTHYSAGYYFMAYFLSVTMVFIGENKSRNLDKKT